jgi:hypothetical protein
MGHVAPMVTALRKQLHRSLLRVVSSLARKRELNEQRKQQVVLQSLLERRLSALRCALGLLRLEVGGLWVSLSLRVVLWIWERLPLCLWPSLPPSGGESVPSRES